jgi:hypothetical protein
MAGEPSVRVVPMGLGFHYFVSGVLISVLQWCQDFPSLR